MCAAVNYGSIDNMKLLLKHKCPWGKYTFQYAIMTEDKDILLWLLKEKCPIDYGSIDASRKLKTSEILHWLITKGITDKNY